MRQPANGPGAYLTGTAEQTACEVVVGTPTLETGQTHSST